MAFISSKALSTPPKPASASATIGASQSAGRRRVPGLGPGDLVGAEQGVVDAADHLGNRVGRVEALVGVGLPGQVGVGRDLPAGQVDRVQPGPDLLHRLVAGQRAERVHVVPLVEQPPQPLGAQPGEGVLLLHGAAQPDHVLRGVGALEPSATAGWPPTPRSAAAAVLGLALAAVAAVDLLHALEATIAHGSSNVLRPLGGTASVPARAGPPPGSVLEKISKFHLE